MPESSSRGIFISYRREDAGAYPRLLQLELRERFPDFSIFIDVDSIEAGVDFAEVISEGIASSVVLIALIGPHWVSAVDSDGRRRLDNPDDYVRFEIHTALERGVRVIPVLVNGATPPQKQQLPPDLHKRARLNALELSYNRYKYDADQLLALIQRVIAAAPNTATAHESSSRAPASAAAIPETLRLGSDVNSPGEGAPQSSEIGQTEKKARATSVLTNAIRIADSFSNKLIKVHALTGTEAALAGADPRRAVRLLADAERVARSITDDISKASALVYVARAQARTNSIRALSLLADAETLARSTANPTESGKALAGIAAALAAIDPDRAERIARSITDERIQAEALGRVSKALVGEDPDRAEHIALSINSEYGYPRVFPDHYSKKVALMAVLKRLGFTDPVRAERIAQSLPDNEAEEPPRKEAAVAYTAGALAVIDSERAESIAWSLSTKYLKVRALVDVAKVLTAIDPDRAIRLLTDAELIARSIIDDEHTQAEALADVAKVLTAIDPDRAIRLLTDAEHIARSITDDDYGEYLQATALIHVAKVLTAIDSDRAIRLLTDAAHIAHLSPSDENTVYVLTDIVYAVADRDPVRAIRLQTDAERIAESITDEASRASAFYSIVEALTASSDSDRQDLFDSMRFVRGRNGGFMFEDSRPY